MVLLIRVRSMSTLLEFSLANVEVVKRSRRKNAMIDLYKLHSPAADETCCVTDEECDNVGGDNR